MSEFIIAVIVISVILMFISKARKKSDEDKREVPSHKVSESEVKPIVKPLTTTNDAAESAPIIKTEENIVVVISPKVVVSSKETTKDIQIPKDSTLRRHALNQLHSLLEFCKENRPSDSSLSRHYDQLVEVKLNDYTNDADEILCLLSFMGFHLILGLHHKTQAHTVTQAPGQQAQAEGRGVPQRVEQRLARTQFLQPLLGPGQMIGFFLAGPQEVGAQRFVLGRQRLRRVKRLCAHLAHMIDPHQGTGLALVGHRQFSDLGR